MRYRFHLAPQVARDATAPGRRLNGSKPITRHWIRHTHAALALARAQTSADRGLSQNLNPAAAKVLKRLHYPLDVILLCVRWYVA